MTCARAGLGAQGCDPITNEQRIAFWRARWDRWLLKQQDPAGEEVALGRKAAEGVAFQKALRKRPRVKLRQPKRAKKSNNVVQLPVQRRA